MLQQLDASGLFAVPAGEISVACLALDEMCALHGRFLDDATPTDVITFAGDAASGTAGEICVCPDVARSYARTHRTDFSAELTLYLVHGYLHLSGCGDTSAAERRAMRRAEHLALDQLRQAGAIPQFGWR